MQASIYPLHCTGYPFHCTSPHRTLNWTSTTVTTVPAVLMPAVTAPQVPVITSRAGLVSSQFRELRESARIPDAPSASLVGPWWSTGACRTGHSHTSSALHTQSQPYQVHTAQPVTVIPVPHCTPSHSHTSSTQHTQSQPYQFHTVHPVTAIPVPHCTPSHSHTSSTLYT